jgi:hypothetical protein
LGLWGKEVDMINWTSDEIAECNRILEEGKKKVEGYDEIDFGGFVAENEEPDLGETDEGGTNEGPQCLTIRFRCRRRYQGI